MPTARKQQISLSDTPYYHCVSRCVRRAFLCGEDAVTGKNYEHRRGWVEMRMLYLSRLFAIEICAYAVMSNHTHIILCVNVEKAKKWTADDVLTRWHQLHKGTLLTQQFMRDGHIPSHLTPFLDATIETYRQRLMDVSWFMRELNENIARQANREDECTGRFWEGRFKSQALLDESALIACMAYVDLNPIRANVDKTPETSAHTSIKMRIRSAKRNRQPNLLNPFIGHSKEERTNGLPFDLKEYLELVDLTGRIIYHDKPGSIDLSLAPILQRLNVPAESWIIMATQFEQHTCTAVGTEAILTDYYQKFDYKRRPKINKTKALLA